MSRLLGGCCAFLLVAGIAGCGTDEGFTDIVVPAGFIRSVNAIPDSPTLRVEIGNNQPQDLGFTQATQFVSSLPDLNLRLDVTYAGVNDRLTLVGGDQLRVGVDSELTLVLAGSMDGPQLIRIQNAPPEDIDLAEQLQLQFVHAASAEGVPVNISLTREGASVLETTLDFPEFTDTVTLSAGDFRIRVTDPGTGNLLWDSGDFSLSAGTRGLVMLSDYFGPGASNVRMLSVSNEGTIPFADERFPAAVRVTNAIPDQGPISVTVGDDVVVENLPFQGVSDYVDIDNGIQPISVTVFGEPDNVLFESDTQTFPSGSFLTLVTTGLDDSNTARLFGDNRRSIPSRALLTVTNAGLSGSTTDVYVVDRGTSIENVNPRARIPIIPESGASQTLQVIEGSYDLIFTTAGTKDVIGGPVTADLVNGGIYSVWLTDAPGGGTPAELILGDDLSP